MAVVRGMVQEVEQQRDSDRGAWGVFRVEDAAGDVHSCVGIGAFKPGALLEIQGRWDEHARFGRRLVVEGVAETRPVNQVELERLLVACLPRPRARDAGDLVGRVVRDFDQGGIDPTLDAIDTRAEELFARVVPDGLADRERVIEEACRTWKARRDSAIATELLRECKVRQPGLDRAYHLFGDTLGKAVVGEPYQLAEIEGIGFLTADRVARAVGASDVNRAAAAAEHVVRMSMNDGHCAVFLGDVEQGIAEMIQCTPEAAADGLRAAVDRGRLRVDDGFIYRPPVLAAERAVTEVLSSRIAGGGGHEPRRVRELIGRFLVDGGSGQPLNGLQREAVAMAAIEPVSLLIGGAGTGKTATLKAIGELSRALGDRVYLMTVAAVAAEKATQMSGFEAGTFHRVLRWDPIENRFQHGADNPLSGPALIVIDEASMPGLNLTRAALRALPAKARVLFVGDDGQLPSIEPGRVLGDLIESGRVPMTRLEEIYRGAANAGVLEIATAVRKGVIPDLPEELAGGFCFFPGENENILELSRALCAEVLPGHGYNVMQDVRVLSPIRNGPVGVNRLNRELQAVLNPAGRPVRGFGGDDELQEDERAAVPRVGDPVLHTQNDYDRKVFNGMIGVMQDGGQVQFPRRGLVDYNAYALRALTPAYAMTPDKMQGSDAPVILTALSMSHRVRLGRRLLYTSLTRSKSMQLVLGSRRAVEFAIENDKDGDRRTMLLRRLREALPAIDQGQRARLYRAVLGEGDVRAESEAMKVWLRSAMVSNRAMA